MDLEEQKEKKITQGTEVEVPAQPSASPAEDATETATGFDFSSGSQRKARSKVDYSGKLFCERYQLQTLLGEGGMGAVYSAVHTGLNKTVAVKILHSSLTDDEGASRRFEREAKATSGLNHANLASVSDFGVSADGSPYFVMEYVQGDSLAALIDKDGSIGTARVVDLFLQVAAAIGYAHNHGVIHRDLKPSNIIVSKGEDGQDLIKVVDFGIAKVLSEQGDNKQNLTQTGEILGSPLYMSPEQCTGKTMDRRSDVYSIGCVMYEALTGKPPHAGDNTVQTILKHINEDPPPMAEVKPGLQLPVGLEKVVLKCVQKHPDARYQSLEELSADLSAIKEGKTPAALSAGTAGGAGQTLAVQRANKSALAAIIIFLLGALAYFAYHLTAKSAPDTFPSQPSVVATQGVNPNRPESYEGRTLSQWTDAIEENPKDPKTYFGRAVLHDMRDERTNAIEDYSKVIELNPKSYEAYKRRSFVYTMLAQYDNALNDANLIIKNLPGEHDSYLTRSFVEEAQGNGPAAVADLTRAIEIGQKKLHSAQSDPRGAETSHWYNHEVAYMQYNLSRALLNIGSVPNALLAIRKSIDMDGEPAAYGQRSLTYTIAGDYPKAIDDGEKATTMDGARSVEWFYLAFAYLGNGDSDKAREAMDKGFALETFPARGYRFQGEYYRVAGMLDAAIKSYSTSTSLEAYAPGYRGRARAYIELGKFHSAEEDLRKADKLVPNNSVTLSFLARAEEENGDSTKANGHLAQAIPANPVGMPPIVYVNRAAVNVHRNNLDSALEDIEKALKIDPFLREAYEMRAKIYLQKKNVAKSVEDREQAGRHLPQIEF